MPIQKEVAPFFSHLTRGDKILIGALIACALLSLPLTRALTKAGRFVQIETDGHVLRVVDLAAEQIIEVSGPLGLTIVEIRDRAVFITASPCRDKICVHSGRLHVTGQLLACLPNKVVIRLIGADEHEYDAVTR